RRKGIFYNNTGEWPKAVECFEKALIFYQRVGDERQQVNVLYNIGVDKRFFGAANSSEFIERSLSLAEKIGYEDGIPINLSGLGADYGNNNRNFDKAASNFTKALEIYERTNNKGGIAEMLKEFARLYLS